MPSLNNHFFKPRPKVKERMINMATFTKYQKKNGEIAWQFSAYLGINPETGKSIKTTRRGFKNKKAAQLELAKLQAEFDAVEWTEKVMDEPTNDYTKKEYTFEEVFNIWWPTHQLSLKESSIRCVEDHFKKHILPKYGNLNIKDITTIYAQKIVNEWALKYKSYRIFHTYVNSVLDYAVMLELIPTNRAALVKYPKDKTIIDESLKFYTLGEVKLMLRAAENNDGIYGHMMLYPLLRLLFYSGLRIGEALALNWQDIDFKNKMINVNKTVSTTKNGHVVVPPKTEKSIAKIPIDQHTLSILKKWKSDQRKLLFSFGITDNHLVFCSSTKGLLYSQYIYMMLKRFCEKNSFIFKGVHATRHTHASILLESGATLKDIQDRLRHANIQMTMNIYSHLTDKKRVETVDKFVAYMNN